MKHRKHRQNTVAPAQFGFFWIWFFLPEGHKIIFIRLVFLIGFYTEPFMIKIQGLVFSSVSSPNILKRPTNTLATAPCLSGQQKSANEPKTAKNRECSGDLAGFTYCPEMAPKIHFFGFFDWFLLKILLTFFFHALVFRQKPSKKPNWTGATVLPYP